MKTPAKGLKDPSPDDLSFNLSSSILNLLAFPCFADENSAENHLTSFTRKSRFCWKCFFPDFNCPINQSIVVKSTIDFRYSHLIKFNVEFSRFLIEFFSLFFSFLSFFWHKPKCHDNFSCLPSYALFFLPQFFHTSLTIINTPYRKWKCSPFLRWLQVARCVKGKTFVEKNVQK